MTNVNNSAPTITNCTFSGNSSPQGGGMRNSSYSSPTITSCTFSGNSSPQGGGMLNNYHSSPTITNCTFSGNESSNGGGMQNNSISSPTITNTIMWGDTNTDTGDPSEIYNTASSSAPNVTYSIVEGGYSGTGNLNVDPLFTSTTDLHLTSLSLAIDAANGCVAPLTDLDGDGRMDIAATTNTGVGPAVDMGAYEYQGGSGDGAAYVLPMPAACCTEDTDSTLSHDYHYCAGARNWYEAEEFCQAYGMHLASIGDAAENTVVNGVISVNATTYIGANDIDTEDTWTWSSGDPWSSSTANWNTGEPNDYDDNEDCGTIDPSTGYWSDVPCDETYAFVCETTS